MMRMMRTMTAGRTGTFGGGASHALRWQEASPRARGESDIFDIFDTWHAPTRPGRWVFDLMSKIAPPRTREQGIIG